MTGYGLKVAIGSNNLSNLFVDPFKQTDTFPHQFCKLPSPIDAYTQTSDRSRLSHIQKSICEATAPKHPARDPS
jgi:hypothetical protein